MSEAPKELEQKVLIDDRPVAAVEPGAALRSIRVLLVSRQYQDKDDAPEWGNDRRDQFLRDLAMDVDLVADAITIVCQKMAALSWSVEGPERTALKWRDKLAADWSEVVQAWVREVCWNDKGGACQIARFAPSGMVDDQERLTDAGVQAIEDGKDNGWDFAGLLPLDSRYITPTGRRDTPLTYTPSSGKEIALHRHQVARLIDSPISDRDKPGYGQCAVSRCLKGAQERGYIACYFKESFSDKPRAGLLLLNNVSVVDYDQAQTVLETKQSQGNMHYYMGQLVLTSAEATQPMTAEEVPFRIAPEGFSRKDTYQETKEIVATAFGLDPLEFGSMPGEQLGSAQQSTVMAKKARGKFLAMLIEGIERELNQKVLPPNCEFKFISQNIEERQEEYTAQGVVITNVKNMYDTGQLAGEGSLISREEGRQMLADAGAIPQEFLDRDITGREEIEDTEAEPEEPEELEEPEEDTGEEGELPPVLQKTVAGSYRERRVKAYSDGRVVIIDLPKSDYRVLPLVRASKATKPSTRHPLKNRQALTTYTEKLRRLFDEWARRAAEELEAAEEDERERLLAALLALLAMRLKAAGQSGLREAFELGLGGELADPEDWEALQAAILSNDRYIDESLIADVRDRFLKDAGTTGFIWDLDTLVATLGALAWRTALYGGAFWAALARGLGVGLRQRGNPVRRFLDPQADHCATCPPKEAEYLDWNDMVARAGIPGDGSDACDGRCRCGVEEEIGGQWVPIL